MFELIRIFFLTVHFLGYKDESLPKSFNDEVKAFSEGIANNNPLDDVFNPFSNKEVEDIDKEINKDKDFEEHGGDNREETPTPPVDAGKFVSVRTSVS